MTINGAITELQLLLKANDMPTYYKPCIKKIIETIQMELVYQMSRLDEIEHRIEMHEKAMAKVADTLQDEGGEFVKVSGRECPWCKAVCASTDKYCHECGWHIADTPQTEGDK